MNKYLYLGFILIFIGCNIPNHKNVYNKIPLGSKVSKSILKEANQVVIYKDNIVLNFNISEDAYRYDPHLLFYDSNLKLYAANYFASEKIESINEYIISAYLNEERFKRQARYINDLPKKFELVYNSKSIFSGGGKISNKLITKIILCHSTKEVQLFIKESNDLYIGVGESPPFIDTSFLKKFNETDTLIFNLADLCFDYRSNKISSRNIKANRLIWDHMLVSDMKIYDSFYDSLYQYIGKQGVPPQKPTD